MRVFGGCLRCCKGLGVGGLLVLLQGMRFIIIHSTD